MLFEYHAIEAQINKFDILGHRAPYTLAKLRELTGIEPKSFKKNDEKLYRLLWDKTIIYNQLTEEQKQLFETQFDKTGLNNGLPELSTDFLGQMMYLLKPTTFEEVVKIEGISHKNLSLPCE